MGFEQMWIQDMEDRYPFDAGYKEDAKRYWDAAQKETAQRCAEIAYNIEPPKSIGRQQGTHHKAGAQQASKAIRKEFGINE